VAEREVDAAAADEADQLDHPLQIDPDGAPAAPAPVAAERDVAQPGLVGELDGLGEIARRDDGAVAAPLELGDDRAEDVHLGGVDKVDPDRQSGHGGKRPPADAALSGRWPRRRSSWTVCEPM